MTTYPGFSREALELIHLYESYGWTFTVSSKGHAIGRAPSGGETCSIARRLAPGNRAHQNATAAFRRWEREYTKEQAMTAPKGYIEHGALKAMEDFHVSRQGLIASGLALGWEADVIPNGAIRLRRSGSSDVVVRKSNRALSKREANDITQRLAKGGDPLVSNTFRQLSQEEWGDYVMEVLDGTPIAERMAVLVPVPAEPVVPVPSDDLPGEHLRVTASGPAPRDSDRTRAPWIASRGARRGYESKAVVEVRAGDEVVGYECADCGKEFDDPHTTASHYRRAHSFRKGRAEQNPTIEAPEDYHPSSRLLEALTNFLADTWGDGVTAEDMAYAALVWMRTRPDLPEPQPREPLTDAQVLDRIRRLVGAEDQTEEVDVLTRDLEASEEQIVTLTRTLAEVQERADRIQADLDAWLSLAPKAQS